MIDQAIAFLSSEFVDLPEKKFVLPERFRIQVFAIEHASASYPASIPATGFGKSNPVASNDTRQQNRRVEIIISGEVIDTQIGGAGGAQPQQ